MKLAKEMTLTVFAKLFPPNTMIMIVTKEKKAFDFDNAGNIMNRYLYRDDLIIESFDTVIDDYDPGHDSIQIKLK